MGIGAVSVFYMLIRTGWSVDVDVAPALVLARELADADRSAGNDAGGLPPSPAPVRRS